MREIKFRGKRISDGEWITGNLVSETNGYMEVKRTFIHLRLSPVEFTEDSLASRIVLHEVDSKTIGQYAELEDKDGHEIYEGCDLHVLEVTNERTLDYVSKVEYVESGFLVTQPDGCQVPLACFHNLETTYPLFEIEVIES